MVLDFQYDDLMLEKTQARNCTVDGVTYGYEFTLRYPSYRGTFVSCIEGFEVKIDGVRVDTADMRFTLKDKQFLVSELGELCHEYWFVLDEATVTVMKSGGLPAGDHQIEVEMVHRIPYTGYFGTYLTLTSNGACTAKIA